MIVTRQPSKKILTFEKHETNHSRSRIELLNRIFEKKEQTMLASRYKANLFKRIISTNNGNALTSKFDDIENTLKDERSKGVIHYLNGDQYEGTLYRGKPDGQGILVFTNGESYRGEFSSGVFHGIGTYSYPSGHRYTGEFINIKMHGRTLLYFKDQFLEELVYYNDRINLESLLTSPTSRLNSLYFLVFLLGCDKPWAKDGSESSYFLSILCNYLSYKPKYKEPYLQLKNAHEIILKPKKPEEIINLLKNGQSLLIPYGCNEHSMGLRLVPTSSQRIRFEFYNSGYGLDNHQMSTHFSKSNSRIQKFQTALTISVPFKEVTPEIIAKILNYNKLTIEETYQIITNIEGSHRECLPIDSVIWQTSQKFYNCSVEWIFVFLKNTLSSEDYLNLRIELFQDCIAEICKKESPLSEEEGKLIKILERKIAKRKTQAYTIYHK